jgi:hypothetical protein
MVRPGTCDGAGDRLVAKGVVSGRPVAKRSERHTLIASGNRVTPSTREVPGDGSRLALHQALGATKIRSWTHEHSPCSTCTDRELASGR